MTIKKAARAPNTPATVTPVALSEFELVVVVVVIAVVLGMGMVDRLLLGMVVLLLGMVVVVLYHIEVVLLDARLNVAILLVAGMLLVMILDVELLKGREVVEGVASTAEGRGVGVGMKLLGGTFALT
ncbi:hypothetical protein F5887DRAFT_320229 [Amanita rubescens]|nr:hypothetical protein F5887DRAFT_320229 [Amanita rubescens]